MDHLGKPSERLATSFAAALCTAGTRVLYGVPGGGNNLDVIGAAEDAGLRFVLTHGETAAALMAAVDGELGDGPGACVVTRGPGTTSVVNGVAHALLDRTPLVVISDSVALGDRERVSHQRVDQEALFRPLTKWAGAVGVDGCDVTLAAILALASAPPPGPVGLDFVPDALRARVPVAPKSIVTGSPSQAQRLLKGSRRPTVLLGVGARHAAAPLRELLQDKQWPVLTTYKAKGLIPESWPNAAGLLTGGTIEAPILRGADLIVAVGLDPVELIPAPWPYSAPVLSLSEWPLHDKYFEARTELVGPLVDLLGIVADSLDPGYDGPGFGISSRIAANERLLEAPTNGIRPQDVVLAARAAAPPGTIATVDSGAHMLVTMPLWEVQNPGEALISSGLATMGFALPAAIGAAIARPAQHVICFTGDGGLGMTLAEIETVARLGLPVTIVVFNDSALSLIEIKQNRSGHGGKSAVRYHATDYAAIAGSAGMLARRVDAARDLPSAFTEALSARRPFLLDIDVDPSSYPHVISAIRGGSRE